MTSLSSFSDGGNLLKGNRLNSTNTQGGYTTPHRLARWRSLIGVREVMRPLVVLPTLRSKHVLTQTVFDRCHVQRTGFLNDVFQLTPYYYYIFKYVYTMRSASPEGHGRLDLIGHGSIALRPKMSLQPSATTRPSSSKGPGLRGHVAALSVGAHAPQATPHLPNVSWIRARCRYLLMLSTPDTPILQEESETCSRSQSPSPPCPTHGPPSYWTNLERIAKRKGWKSGVDSPTPENFPPALKKALHVLLKVQLPCVNETSQSFAKSICFFARFFAWAFWAVSRCLVARSALRLLWASFTFVWMSAATWAALGGPRHRSWAPSRAPGPGTGPGPGPRPKRSRAPGPGPRVQGPGPGPRPRAPGLGPRAGPRAPAPGPRVGARAQPRVPGLGPRAPRPGPGPGPAKLLHSAFRQQSSVPGPRAIDSASPEVLGVFFSSQNLLIEASSCS